MFFKLFFDSPCRESVEKNVFSLAAITASDLLFIKKQ